MLSFNYSFCWVFYSTRANDYRLTNPDKLKTQKNYFNKKYKRKIIYIQTTDDSETNHFNIKS